MNTAFLAAAIVSLLAAGILALALAIVIALEARDRRAEQRRNGTL